MASTHDEHMKRVSFGPEDDVKLIVYDDGLTNSTYTFNSRRSTTPTDYTTLNRVLVTSEEAEIPRPISPPAQLDENPPIQQGVSPPLPSLIRKMESEVDNPFRPEETLYHEVDPIVKAYSQRPFPPSPTGSPIPQDLTPIKNGRHVTLDNNSLVDGPNRSATQSPIHQQYHQNNSTTFDSTPKKHQQQGNGVQEPIPPPNNVELVHVDNKKKKCACCSIQ